MAGKNGAVEEPDEDEAQWAKASPRLKSIIGEALDEYAARHSSGETDETDEGDDEPEDTDDGSGKPPAAGSGKRRAPAAAAVGGKLVSAAPKRARQTRPSGGSFLDVLLGR